jgi:hypothetical protein
MGLSDKILRKPEKEEKPLCLKIEDAKADMIASVNRCLAQLPHFIIEPILKDIYFQVVEGKRAEIEAARLKANDESEDG